MSFIDQARAAKRAGIALATLNRAAKDAALHAMADALADAEQAVLEANLRDVDRARENGTSDALIDRLQAHIVEAGLISLRAPAINGQAAIREKKSQHTQRYVDEEHCPPTEAGDQNSAERWTESGANRGHRSEHAGAERGQQHG